MNWLILIDDWLIDWLVDPSSNSLGNGLGRYLIQTTNSLERKKDLSQLGFASSSENEERCKSVNNASIGILLPRKRFYLTSCSLDKIDNKELILLLLSTSLLLTTLFRESFSTNGSSDRVIYLWATSLHIIAGRQRLTEELQKGTKRWRRATKRRIIHSNAIQINLTASICYKVTRTRQTTNKYRKNHFW